VWKSGLTTITNGKSYNYLEYPAVADNSENLCSKSYAPDRELAAITLMEKWNMYGVKTLFYKTTYDVKKDNIWGEDNDRYITDEWNVMAYFQLPKENKVWSKFGIEGINDFSMYISKLHFKSQTHNYIPRVGDLILTPYNNKLYEIAEVKEEAPIFMLSKQYAWEIIVKKAKIENELSVYPSLSASPIAEFYNVVDLYDIKNDIDTEKTDIVYYDSCDNKTYPFGNW